MPSDLTGSFKTTIRKMGGQRDEDAHQQSTELSVVSAGQLLPGNLAVGFFISSAAPGAERIFERLLRMRPSVRAELGTVRGEEGCVATVQHIVAQRDLWLAMGPENQALADAVGTALLGCRRAVKQLEEGLGALGYPVQDFLRPSPADLGSKLAELEARTGVPIPRVVREFWRVVGGVSFVDLENYQHDAFWSERGIIGRHGFCDGFHVDACDADWIAYTLEDYENYAEDDDRPSFRYSLSPDGYHKDDISGGPPYAVGRNSVWQPTWENFSWSGYRRPQTAAPDPTDFLSYVRTALLECAGFPGLLGHPGFEPLRLSLVKGLEAF